jgi:hypothetical protein
MPYGTMEYSSDTSDSAPDYAYIIATGPADSRVEPEQPRWTTGVVTSTDAVPDHGHMYYEMDAHGNISIIEDDIEPEPTLEELVRDADWTI